MAKATIRNHPDASYVQCPYDVECSKGICDSFSELCAFTATGEHEKCRRYQALKRGAQ